MGKGEPRTHGTPVKFFINGYRSLKFGFKPAGRRLIDFFIEKFPISSGKGVLGADEGLGA